MKTKILIATLISAMVTIVAAPAVLVSPASAQGYVSGHYRSNGTYVQPYYRGPADGNPYNNKNAW